MKIIIFVFTLFFFSPFIFGRGPAVHPITGLSVDEEKVIPSPLARGFDFRSSQLTWIQQKNKTTLPNVIQIIGLLFLLALPFAVWHRLLAGVNKKDKSSPSLSPKKNIDKKHDDDDEDDDDNDQKMAA
jgi:hypothetical protein